MSLAVRMLLIATLLLVAESSAAKAERLSSSLAYMKLLFCAYGSIGQQPQPLPPGFENQFAVAVVEVNSSYDFEKAPLPTITLIDPRGIRTMSKRVISVEVFDEPYELHEGNVAFYLNTDPRGHTHKWN